MTIHVLSTTVILIAWVAFLAYWVIAAFFVKRSTSSRARYRTPTLALRIIMYAFVVILIYEGARNPGALGEYELFFLTNPLLEAVGAALTVVGVAFAVWARVYLGRNWGMPMTLRAEPELITSGPYRHVRHPIYTGVLLALFGSTVATGSWWILIFVTSLFYFFVSALQEERDMQEKFPDTYPAYKARTKMLIPFVL